MLWGTLAWVVFTPTPEGEERWVGLGLGVGVAFLAKEGPSFGLKLGLLLPPGPT